MRLPFDIPAALLMATMLLGGTPVCAQTQEAVPTPERVRAALEQVRQDPLWSQKKKERVLRFKRSEPPAKKDDPKPATDITRWVEWITDAARTLVWFMGAACVAVVLVGLRRWTRLRDKAIAPPPDTLPSHVSALDIRPNSLPGHIGDAVYQLWLQGAHHQALSLLYRGTLSRLVHQHAVPIQAASTEEECVALAGTRLDSQRSALVRQLVGVWQRAIYGDQWPSAEALRELCDGFERLLAGPAPAGAAA